MTTRRGIVPFRPIRINNNDEFTIENGVTGGNGTEDNPYIIEGWEISGLNSGFCIFIGNTTQHFVIENCSLSGAYRTVWTTYYSNSGIHLYNVTNGTIKFNISLMCFRTTRIKVYFLRALVLLKLKAILAQARAVEYKWN